MKHGESCDVHLKLIYRALSTFKQKLKPFSLQDVFNSNACSLFYYSAQYHSLAFQRSRGRHKAIYLSIISVFAKSDRTKTFEPSFVKNTHRGQGHLKSNCPIKIALPIMLAATHG